MRKIYKSNRFKNQYKEFNWKLQKKVKIAISYLEKNEFPASLKVHMLKGELAGIYSCSVNNSHRIIFRVIKNNDLELILVWDHSIYKQTL